MFKMRLDLDFSLWSTASTSKIKKVNPFNSQVCYFKTLLWYNWHFKAWVEWFLQVLFLFFRTVRNLESFVYLILKDIRKQTIYPACSQIYKKWYKTIIAFELALPVAV